MRDTVHRDRTLTDRDHIQILSDKVSDQRNIDLDFRTFGKQSTQTLRSAGQKGNFSHLECGRCSHQAAGSDGQRLIFIIGTPLDIWYRSHVYVVYAGNRKRTV